MIIELDEYDNKSLNDFIEEHNRNSNIFSQIIIDVYIRSLEFTDDDVLFECVIIEVDNNHHKSSASDIGETVFVKLSGFDNYEKNVLKSFIREVKIRKMGI